MKRKIKISASILLCMVLCVCIFTFPQSVKAVEIYDYSNFWAMGNAKISVDTGIYCSAFSGTVGYGGVMYPYGSSFTVSCDYRIFAACAAGGRFFYFTEISPDFPDCNIVVYDSNSGLYDIFAVSNLHVSSNDLVAADSSGNIYFVPSDNGSLVKCFAMSGRPCAEISLGGSVNKLITAGNGNVLAVCSNGNYLINSSGSCTYVGGGSDIFPSGNGYFSNGSGTVYNSSLSSVYTSLGIAVCTSGGYVYYSDGKLNCADYSGKLYAAADCIDNVSRLFAMGDTVITFNGSGVFDLYTGNDFYELQENTTEPPTQIVTEEITRPVETTSESQEQTEYESSDTMSSNGEIAVVSDVYDFDENIRYILNVFPSTKESEFIGNFSMKNCDFILQRGNDTNLYIANGDVISFVSDKGSKTYRIVVNKDFNCDGKFNGNDVDAMANLLLVGGNIQQWQQMCADSDKDGNIALKDLYDLYLNL